MKTLSENYFFDELFKKKMRLEMEDRIGLGYKTYGIYNHAEFIDYMNPHDKCLWDAIIPGYNEVINKKLYFAHYLKEDQKLF